MKSPSETKKFWDDRYSRDEFIYGTEPNDFFKEQLDKLEPGRLLLPGEGEGRNAVYAARNGWHVDAFDLSRDGRKKAMAMSDEFDVSINYEVADYESVEIASGKYDAMALIYAHMGESIRRQVHRKLIKVLKRGGTLIFEAFSKQQLGNKSGGPKDETMLYSLEDLKSDFKSLSLKIAEEDTQQISEGDLHQGMANIIHIVATSS